MSHVLSVVVPLPVGAMCRLHVNTMIVPISVRAMGRLHV